MRFDLGDIFQAFIDKLLTKLREVIPVKIKTRFGVATTRASSLCVYVLTMCLVWFQFFGFFFFLIEFFFPCFPGISFTVFV